MNKRKRKKWLKRHNLYVNPKELWNLDYTIAEFVLPRLRKFKNATNSYPENSEIDVFEKWISTIDKMILAFEYLSDEDEWWIGNSKYDYKQEFKRRQEVIKEGLELFAKYFSHLWW